MQLRRQALLIRERWCSDPPPVVGLVFWIALAMAPVAAVAQGGAVFTLIDTTHRDVRAAITRHLAGPGSSIKAADITVKNVRVESDFATADVTGKTFDPPIVFLKKAAPGQTWEGGQSKRLLERGFFVRQD